MAGPPSVRRWPDAEIASVKAVSVVSPPSRPVTGFPGGPWRGSVAALTRKRGPPLTGGPGAGTARSTMGGNALAPQDRAALVC